MPIIKDFFGLFFPRTCSICGEVLVGGEHEICMSCLLSLPEAETAKSDDNFVKRRFVGRIPVEHATALLIFSRKSKAQRLLHQIKYMGNTDLAVTMGRQMGLLLAENRLYDDIDLLVPVPLHRRKERQRGYNQSLLLCQGIAQTFPRPIADGNLRRIKHTESQTHKNRVQRLENMKEVFSLDNPDAFRGKHLLLIDDVITTGATTEACWNALKTAAPLRISIAALAASGDM